MKLSEVAQILLAHIGQKIGPDDARIVHHRRNGETLRELGRHLRGRLRIDQIDLDRV